MSMLFTCVDSFTKYFERSLYDAACYIFFRYFWLFIVPRTFPSVGISSVQYNLVCLTLLVDILHLQDHFFFFIHNHQDTGRGSQTHNLWSMRKGHDWIADLCSMKQISSRSTSWMRQNVVSYSSVLYVLYIF